MADFTTNSWTSTSTVDHLVAKTVDTILNYSPATLFFLGNQKRWIGTQMKFPVKYAQSSQGISFDGLEKFSTTKTAEFVNMTFSPTGREMPVVISQIEADVNASNRVQDLVARQMASDAQDMADDIAQLFYTAHTVADKNFWSLLDACDDGTVSTIGTYGDISRTTYTGITGNYVSIGGNLTLASMRSEFNDCSHGPDSPNLLITTKAVWGYYEKLLTPTMSTQVQSIALAGYPNFIGATRGGLPNIAAAGTKLSAYQGFNAIYYAGVPVIADERCNTGYMYFINTRTIAFYGLESTHPDYKPVKFTSDTMDGVYNVPATTGFSFSGFNTPIDQYGRVGHVILMGNLICNNPRLNGVAVGITGA
jgi:hypothetical protein